MYTYMVCIHVAELDDAQAHSRRGALQGGLRGTSLSAGSRGPKDHINTRISDPGLKAQYEGAARNAAL